MLQYMPFMAIKGKAIEMQSYACMPCICAIHSKKCPTIRDFTGCTPAIPESASRSMFSVALLCGHWRLNPQFYSSLQRMCGEREIFRDKVTK